MYPLLILVVVVIVIGAFAFLKLRKGKFVDKLAKDIWNESEPTTNETIKDISSAEKALIAKRKLADKNAVESKQESMRIGDYLAEKGVVKPIEKRKEADDKEEVK